SRMSRAFGSARFAASHWGSLRWLASRSSVAPMKPRRSGGIRHRRPETAVERVAGLRHLDQELRRPVAHAAALLIETASGDEIRQSHAVDVAQRATGEWRKAEAQDGADIGFAHVGQHVLLETARGLKRLDEEQPLLDFVHIELACIFRCRNFAD